MQLDASLLLDLRGARGSMGLGEHVEQGHTNSPSRRLLPSADFNLEARAAASIPR